MTWFFKYFTSKKILNKRNTIRPTYSIIEIAASKRLVATATIISSFKISLPLSFVFYHKLLLINIPKQCYNTIR